MPKEGFKSLTIRQELVDELKIIYETNKQKLRRQGISGFAGFLVMCCNNWNDKHGSNRT